MRYICGIHLEEPGECTDTFCDHSVPHYFEATHEDCIGVSCMNQHYCVPLDTPGKKGQALRYMLERV